MSAALDFRRGGAPKTGATVGCASVLVLGLAPETVTPTGAIGAFTAALSLSFSHGEPFRVVLRSLADLAVLVWFPQELSVLCLPSVTLLALSPWMKPLP